MVRYEMRKRRRGWLDCALVYVKALALGTALTASIVAAVPDPPPQDFPEMRSRLFEMRTERLMELERENELLRAAAKKRLGKNDIEVIGLHAFQLEGVDWDGRELEAFVEIAWRESRWVPTGQDPRSTASGLFGFLDGTYANYGPKTDSPILQSILAVRYIQDRYGVPRRALEWWMAHGWY